MLVISEEGYLARCNAARGNIGDAALHRQPGSTPKSRDRASKRQWILDGKVIERRAALRVEYARLRGAGLVRPPTRRERLEATARGNPENPSVRAARRILARSE